MPARHSMSPLRPPWVLILVAFLCVDLGSSDINFDGGRSDLPGMKQDMFDQMKKNKQGARQRMGKGPPDCPKSDKMTPFTNLAFVGSEIFVRLDSTEGPCHKLISVGGANFTVLYNASRSCGPPGEWKRRIAEEMSAIFFQGGLDWPRNDNETMEVETEEGNFTTTVSEEKFEKMMECWKQSCGCEQAKNPTMKIFFITLLCIALAGLSFDSIKVAIENFKGKKPPKHVVDKKGNRMVKTDRDARRLCDICRKPGTTYTSCVTTCDYDLCESCYQAERKKVKAEWKKWCETHPEDAKKKKKGGGDEDDDDDDKKSGSESGPNDTKAKKDSETEGNSSGKDDSEAEKKSDKSGDEQ